MIGNRRLDGRVDRVCEVDELSPRRPCGGLVSPAALHIRSSGTGKVSTLLI